VTPNKIFVSLSLSLLKPLKNLLLLLLVFPPPRGALSHNPITSKPTAMLTRRREKTALALAAVVALSCDMAVVTTILGEFGNGKWENQHGIRM
jgi:hypothetical protein